MVDDEGEPVVALGAGEGDDPGRRRDHLGAEAGPDVEPAVKLRGLRPWRRARSELGVDGPAHGPARGQAGQHPARPDHQLVERPEILAGLQHGRGQALHRPPEASLTWGRARCGGWRCRPRRSPPPGGPTSGPNGCQIRACSARHPSTSARSCRSRASNPSMSRRWLSMVRRWLSIRPCWRPRRSSRAAKTSRCRLSTAVVAVERGACDQGETDDAQNHRDHPRPGGHPGQPAPIRPLDHQGDGLGRRGHAAVPRALRLLLAASRVAHDPSLVAVRARPVVSPRDAGAAWTRTPRLPERAGGVIESGSRAVGFVASASGGSQSPMRSCSTEGGCSRIERRASPAQSIPGLGPDGALPHARHLEVGLQLAPPPEVEGGAVEGAAEGPVR